MPWYLIFLRISGIYCPIPLNQSQLRVHRKQWTHCAIRPVWPRRSRRGRYKRPWARVCPDVDVLLSRGAPLHFPRIGSPFLGSPLFSTNQARELLFAGVSQVQVAGVNHKQSRTRTFFGSESYLFKTDMQIGGSSPSPSGGGNRAHFL